MPGTPDRPPGVETFAISARLAEVIVKAVALRNDDWMELLTTFD
ncbi:hypothetical protein [Microbacterium flavescens]|nr:hypothetical protein [Microbacterium flavescens]